MKTYRNASLWFDLLPEEIQPRAALEGALNVDVAIVGAGYTGLWTAYYLKRLSPGLSIAVVEAETAGFGASGRNGGWVVGEMAGEAKYLASLPESRRALCRQLLTGMVDEIAKVVRQEGIACDFHQGGVLYAAARYPEQLARQRASLAQLYEMGYTEADFYWLEAEALNRQVRLRNPYGAIYSPHCAVVQPAKLVRGLAQAVERQGVLLFERSPVLDIRERTLITAKGQVRANVMVPALEGYSCFIKPLRHFLLPVQSMIIATEPLSATHWDELGLADRPAFSDGSRLVTYGQRTADNRLVFGARGGYRFGGKPRNEFDPADPEFRWREALLHELFPALGDIRITHGWGGTLGVARQFAPYALYDRQTGMAWAGGYGGEGVAASNLFGRTLADLILARDSEWVRMPWVFADASPARVLRRWEPEPCRWLVYQAVRLAYAWEEALYRSAQVPRWRKRMAGALAEWLERLLQ